VSVGNPKAIVEDGDFAEHEEILSSLTAVHECHEVGLSSALASAAGRILTPQTGHHAPERKPRPVFGELLDRQHHTPLTTAAADAQSPTAQLAERQERDRRVGRVAVGHPVEKSMFLLCSSSRVVG